MSVNSIFFLLFLPPVVWIHYTLPKRYQYLWLFTASLFFYLSNDIRYIIGLAFCIITTYAAGLLLVKINDSGRKWILLSCIAANLTSLFLFRYLLPDSPFVPLGISFYSLQAIGYIIDVFRGKTAAEKNVIRYAVYIAFFPTVISGPIQRSFDLLPQIKAGRSFDYNKAHSGLYLLFWGYFIKVVIADQLGPMVDFAFKSPEEMPGATLLWATVLYAVQLYCDFAGYSVLAIGTAKMLGFDIGVNFMRPYFSTSVRDFWSRWHISLSTWLKDYVYIPLGGSRKGKCRTQLNLLVTFLVSGMWHGGGVNFMAWGALHGVYRILENLLSGIIPKKLMEDHPGKNASDNSKMHRGWSSMASRIFRIIGTFVLVDFAWLFFKADSLEQAFAILYRIFFCFHFNEMTYYGSYLLGGTRQNLLLMLLGIIVVFAVDYIHERKISIENVMAGKMPTVARWAVYITFALLLLFVAVRNYGQAASTFIYERF